MRGAHNDFIFLIRLFFNKG